MQITIELRAGNTPFGKPTKAEIQKNIEALERAIDGKPQSRDFILLLDTKSILEGIQKQLPSV